MNMKAKIVSRKNLGHCIQLEVEATDGNNVWRTFFNLPPAVVEDGSYREHIKEWLKNLKKAKQIQLPEEGEEISL